MTNKDDQQVNNLPSPSKLLGTYPQKQDGLFMQRIPVFAGRINWTQWRRIAQIARRYTPQAPLHVTTRQCIELHNLHREDTGRVIEELSLAGISVFGAGGDSLRNVTVHPGWECDPNGIDVVPLARLVREHLREQAPLLSLGRKFKISFSGSWQYPSQPYLNDLGFTALRPGLFEAVGAGSLGAQPEPGILLYAGLEADEVIALCQAAVELFNELGDRENRRKARLRHIRQRLGDEEFKAQLHQRFEAARQRVPAVKLTLAGARPGWKCLHVLPLPAGDISADAALALADAAQGRGAEVRINLTHGLELYGPEAVDLPPELEAMTGRPSVTACPGAESCSKALVGTKAMARHLHGLKDLLGGRSVGVSGCPNDCGRCRAADVGLSGRVQTVDGRRVEAFEVFCGGGNGASRQLGRSVGRISAESLLADPAQLVKMIN